MTTPTSPCPECGAEFDNASRHYYAEHPREWKLIMDELLAEDGLPPIRASLAGDPDIWIGGKKL